MYTKFLDLLDSSPDTAFAFGESCFAQLAPLMQGTGAQKILAFAGRNSIDESGAWSRILDALALTDIYIVRFSDIEPEPGMESVGRMLECLKKEKPDAVMAIGGGSPMDAAKAAYLIYQAGGELNDYFGMNKFSQKNPGKKLKRVVCVPTTSGTGSEATPYSNIVDHALGVKKLIVEEQIIPEYSFIHPALSMTMPERVTVATGLDALAHSLEGFLNIGQDNKNADANKWALESIKLIVGNLPIVLKEPRNFEARQALAAAACLGGMVIRYKSTALPHLCSFSWFGRIPHGIAVAALLPYAWDYYLADEAVAKRTLELKGIFPGAGDTAEEIVGAYIKFVNSCSVSTALKDYESIDEELLEKTAGIASENKMKLELAPKPVPLADSREILSEILKNAWEGKRANYS